MGVKHPNEVFTPRNPQVNESMYVERPDLEKALRSGVNGSLHVLIHGESGSGKYSSNAILAHDSGPRFA